MKPFFATHQQQTRNNSLDGKDDDAQQQQTSTQLPLPPRPSYFYKNFLIYSESQLNNPDERRSLTVAIHGHYSRDNGGRKFFYVHSPEYQRQSVSSLVDQQNDNNNFCLLQQSVSAGSHKCSRVAIWIRNTTIEKFSSYQSSNIASLHIETPPAVQEFVKALNKKFLVTPGSQNQLKVRCEIESCVATCRTVEVFCHNSNSINCCAGKIEDIRLANTILQRTTESGSECSNGVKNNRFQLAVSDTRVGNPFVTCGKDLVDTGSKTVEREEIEESAHSFIGQNLIASAEDHEDEDGSFISAVKKKKTNKKVSKNLVAPPPVRNPVDAEFPGKTPPPLFNDVDPSVSSLPSLPISRILQSPSFYGNSIKEGDPVEQLQSGTDVFEYLGSVCSNRTKVDVLIYLHYVSPFRQSYSLIISLLYLRGNYASFPTLHHLTKTAEPQAPSHSNLIDCSPLTIPPSVATTIPFGNQITASVLHCPHTLFSRSRSRTSEANSSEYCPSKRDLQLHSEQSFDLPHPSSASSDRLMTTFSLSCLPSAPQPILHHPSSSHLASVSPSFPWNCSYSGNLSTQFVPDDYSNAIEYCHNSEVNLLLSNYSSSSNSTLRRRSQPLEYLQQSRDKHLYYDYKTSNIPSASVLCYSDPSVQASDEPCLVSVCSPNHDGLHDRHRSYYSYRSNHRRAHSDTEFDLAVELLSSPTNKIRRLLSDDDNRIKKPNIKPNSNQDFNSTTKSYHPNSNHSSLDEFKNSDPLHTQTMFKGDFDETFPVVHPRNVKRHLMKERQRKGNESSIKDNTTTDDDNENYSIGDIVEIIDKHQLGEILTIESECVCIHLIHDTDTTTISHIPINQIRLIQKSPKPSSSITYFSDNHVKTDLPIFQSYLTYNRQQQLVATPFSLSTHQTSYGVLCFFWDLEATGLDVLHDDITQIACVCRRFYFADKQNINDKRLPHNFNDHQTSDMGYWEIIDGYPNKVFNRYVYTNRSVPIPVVELTGITNNFLDSYGVSFSQALTEWRNWIISVRSGYENCSVWFVAHNGNRYDLPLLFQQESVKLGQQPGTFLESVGVNGIVDTVILSRRLQWGGDVPRRSHKLQTLYYDTFHCRMPDEHDALGDVIGLAALMNEEPFLTAWRTEMVGWNVEEYLYEARYEGPVNNRLGVYVGGEDQGVVTATTDVMNRDGTHNLKVLTSTRKETEKMNTREPYEEQNSDQSLTQTGCHQTYQQSPLINSIEESRHSIQESIKNQETEGMINTIKYNKGTREYVNDTSNPVNYYNHKTDCSMNITKNCEQGFTFNTPQEEFRSQGEMVRITHVPGEFHSDNRKGRTGVTIDSQIGKNSIVMNNSFPSICQQRDKGYRQSDQYCNQRHHYEPKSLIPPMLPCPGRMREEITAQYNKKPSQMLYPTEEEKNSRKKRQQNSDGFHGAPPFPPPASNISVITTSIPSHAAKWSRGSSGGLWKPTTKKSNETKRKQQKEYHLAGLNPLGKRGPLSKSAIILWNSVAGSSDGSSPPTRTQNSDDENASISKPQIKQIMKRGSPNPPQRLQQDQSSQRQEHSEQTQKLGTTARSTAIIEWRTENSSENKTHLEGNRHSNNECEVKSGTSTDEYLKYQRRPEWVVAQKSTTINQISNIYSVDRPGGSKSAASTDKESDSMRQTTSPPKPTTRREPMSEGSGDSSGGPSNSKTVSRRIESPPVKHLRILKRETDKHQDGKMHIAAAIAGLSYDVASETYKTTQEQIRGSQRRNR